jgi:hypothetical protein
MIQDFYKENFGTTASQATLTHLKRELMHAILELILNDEFMEAYEHGIVIKCPDGILWRFYPQFFTYSADYPEKWVFNDSALCSIYLMSSEFFWQQSKIWGDVSVHDVRSRRSMSVVLEQLSISNVGIMDGLTHLCGLPGLMQHARLSSRRGQASQVLEWRTFLKKELKCRLM